MSGFHFHHHGHEDHAHYLAPENQRRMRLATYCSVGVATSLLLGKVIAWWLSDSLAMRSSLTDSFFDLVTAVISLIALLVLWSTRSFGIRAFNNLMGREMPAEEKATIEQIVRRVPEIRSVHNVKTRYSGTKPFMQLHIDIDAGLSFAEAHTITDRLERALMHAFPGGEIIIHPDPYGSNHHH